MTSSDPKLPHRSDSSTQPQTIAQTPSLADTAARLSGSHDSSPETQSLPQIPGYAIECEIARGAMGVVYRARHLQLNRPAAIKMILGGKYHNPASRFRFLIEAEAVARLDHPNVIHVYEFGTHDDLPFFALEFVGGGTLAAKIERDGKLSPRASAEMLVKLASGIAAAHAKAVVHRDLKPANVLLTEDGEPTIADFGLARVGESDVTAQGAVMGTPSYMAPEQAAGRVSDVGTHSDIYALGAILYELLTGVPPFKGNTVMETIQLVITREPISPRASVPAVPRDLETICLKCLQKEPPKRYATAEALTTDLQAFLAGRPITARPVGVAERAWKWVKRSPGVAATVAAALCALIGIAFAAAKVQRDLRDAEVRRAEDVRTAEASARERQREARAEDLVRALSVAEPGAVPVLLSDLADYRPLARPHLLTLAARPVGERGGIHARLALLGDSTANPTERDTLRQMIVSDAVDCTLDELTLVLGRLDPTFRDVALQKYVSSDGEHGLNKLKHPSVLRWAAVLARLAPDDPRWPTLAVPVVRGLVRLNAVDASPFTDALRPVRHHLVGELKTRYTESRQAVESGRLTTSQLVAEAAAFDLAANFLASYTNDRPQDLAELAIATDPRHYTLFAESFRLNRASVVPILEAEVTTIRTPRWVVHGLAVPLAGVGGAFAVSNWMSPDPFIVDRDKRRGYAAAALVSLGSAEVAWPLFRFPDNGDPTARSYLVARLADIRTSPVDLMHRFDTESDVAAKRAIVIALGDFPLEFVPSAERAAFAKRLVGVYRTHPDSGLHSAIDWLLRRKWGKADEVDAVDGELARETKARNPLATEAKEWHVNREKQTYAVVRGPVEFTIGSPPTEQGRYSEEKLHRKLIPRSFAIATREVTVEQFLRFQPEHTWTRSYSPGPDTPMLATTWYEAAGYCNWLSEHDGIPKDQWCYEPNKEGRYEVGMRIKPAYLSLKGYRLPTEVEWEFACRGGAVTTRHYGRGDELLPRYEWFVKNSDGRSWPVGLLRPNERGLFDALGNVFEWCGDPNREYSTDQLHDQGGDGPLVIDELASRRVRGGSFLYQAVVLRCANRLVSLPGYRYNTYGIRPARTLP